MIAKPEGVEAPLAKRQENGPFMSNDTHLLSTASPNVPRKDLQLQDRLLTASYSIPLFWYALFDERSVVEARYGHVRYPALTKPTKEAILLACDRWPRIRDLLGADVEPLFCQWVD